MCGIAGIVSTDAERYRPVRPDELSAMCAAMVHRGPDDEGLYLEGGAGLAMRRLSIIDLEGGHQPIGNEDGTIWAVLNGEIYNYRELRRALEKRGHTFRTRSDTETIVHLYEAYGDACVEHMRGMFAFAVWDSPNRRLLLGRDRMGIKPLYYTLADGRLLFASELKALLAVPDVKRVLDPRSFAYYLSFLVTPPANSIVAGVRKLPPAHTLTVSPGPGMASPRVEKYWDAPFVPDRTRSPEDLAARLRSLLEESVRMHLVSDVPLGAFLSGGIDSSSVVATMARLMDRPVKTFSIGFRDPDFNELPYAREVAKAFGTEHHELLVEPDALQIVEEIAWHVDEPFGDSSAIPTYLVSKLAAEHVKVVLSGDGGDEIFGGYDKYRVEGHERRFDFLPAPARRLLGELGARMPVGAKGRNFLIHHGLTGAERYFDAGTLFRREERARLLQPNVFEALGLPGDEPWRRHSGDWIDAHWLSALQHLDFQTYLPLDILTKVDRMSMAHSIEARVPLLDHRLVEFAATLPPELQLHGDEGKHLFKRALRGLVPDAVLDRPKHGFAVPVGRWFRGPLRGFVRDVLLGTRALRRGVFQPRYVERLLQIHHEGRDLGAKIWTLMSFELWCRTFLDAAPRRAEPAPASIRIRPVAAVAQHAETHTH